MVEIITKTYRIENESLSGYEPKTGFRWEATGINGTITIDDCARVVNYNINIDGLYIYDKDGNSINEKVDIEGFKAELADNIRISYDSIVSDIDTHTLINNYFKG